MNLSLIFPWQRVLVVGLGRSGVAVARLLRALGCEVAVYDRNAQCPVEPSWSPFLGAEHPPEAAFANVDAVILSPGIDPRVCLQLAARLVPHAAIYGEMSLAMALVHAWWPTLPSVMITGTNGKSTVTTLIGELLRAGGMAPFVGGNLGEPLCEMLHDVVAKRRLAPDALVLECSSYQLETMHDFACDVAMVLNLSPDHLERYGSMEAYARTKTRVFSGLRGHGLAMLDAEDPFCESMRSDAPHGLLCVDGSEPPHRIDVDGEEWLVLGAGEKVRRSQVKLQGRHNAKNVLFAVKSAMHLGVAFADCLPVLANFEGLAHRMRCVGTIGGVDFYDDSKATNIAGVLAGLAGFPRKYVLIAGGMAKAGDDPSPLRQRLAEQGKGLVAMGRDGKLFYELASDIVPVRWANDMQEAVTLAFSLAAPGDAVLLSPACASWDQYRSFAHRGDVFIEQVERLAKQSLLS
jgi:UDP-N-acetylmuramoylalanine--D-glutamate ligase